MLSGRRPIKTLSKFSRAVGMVIPCPASPPFPFPLSLLTRRSTLLFCGWLIFLRGRLRGNWQQTLT